MTNTRLLKNFIDNAAVDARSDARADVVNPSTGGVVASAPISGAEDVDAAYAAAAKAFQEWGQTTPSERQQALLKIADAIEKRSDEFVKLESENTGKPHALTASEEIPPMLDQLRFFAGAARILEGKAAGEYMKGMTSFVRREPIGVVGQVTPWNYPMMMAVWKIAPALAAGNTVVLKPAEDTPTSATILARLALEAGIPEGVLNVVHGYGPSSVGEALTRDPRVDRITFTGETNTGRIISRAAADNLTPVSLEMGGKNCNIVFADAELDNAVDWSVQSIFRNAGQICLSGSRLYVQREIYDDFLDRFVAAAEAMKFGDPLDPETEFGPLSSEQHYRKVKGYIDSVESVGGRMLTGGLGDGWFVKPTILVDMPADSPHVCEEIFGPVVVVTPFDTEDEVVRLANDTDYGLDAQLFTEDLHKAHRVSARLDVGTVWVNCFFIRDLRAPFGGVGHSGVGREGGNFSREFFTEPKAVIMQINQVPADREV
mgnify:CR=1 FL=1